MRTANFFKASILFVGLLILTGCNPPDFGKVKPDFSQIKNVPTSILNIGKSFNSSKNWDTASTTVGTPLPLHDILAGSLANENRGADFFASVSYALDTDPEIIAKRREVEAKIASLRVAERRKIFKLGRPCMVA